MFLRFAEAFLCGTDAAHGLVKAGDGGIGDAAHRAALVQNDQIIDFQFRALRGGSGTRRLRHAVLFFEVFETHSFNVLN